MTASLHRIVFSKRIGGDWLTTKVKRQRLLWMMLRELENKPMSEFGEPKCPKHLSDLKKRMSERESESTLRLERAWIDYHDRLRAAEQKVIGDFDAHALEAESAMKELSNRGEQVTAAASNISGQDTEAEGTTKTFPIPLDPSDVVVDIPVGQTGGEGALAANATFPDASKQATG
jgi:hypothetical protein